MPPGPASGAFPCPYGVNWGYQPPQTAPAPAKPAEWPAWARGLADLHEPCDVGVGSTAKRKLAEGGVAFQVVMQGLGCPCACDERAAEWNSLYPY